MIARPKNRTLTEHEIAESIRLFNLGHGYNAICIYLKVSSSQVERELKKRGLKRTRLEAVKARGNGRTKRPA